MEYKIKYILSKTEYTVVRQAKKRNKIFQKK